MGRVRSYWDSRSSVALSRASGFSSLRSLKEGYWNVFPPARRVRGSHASREERILPPLYMSFRLLAGRAGDHQQHCARRQQTAHLSEWLNLPK